MGRRRLAIVAAFVFLSAAGAYWLASPGTPASASLLRPDDREIIAAGADIYAANCASCHGAELKGQPDWQSPGADGLMPAPPHDETGHTWHHPDEILFAITKYGVAEAAQLTDYTSAMPVYAGVLSDEEIVAALSWIKAQWPAEIRARHDEMNAQYQALERDVLK